MDSLDAAHSLSDEDLLSLSIGRVVRAHARVEYGLRNVHEALETVHATPGAAIGFVGAEQLVKACLKRLKQSGVSAEIAESGRRAVEAAQDANALRNAIVHDLWLLESPSDSEMTARWNTFGTTPGVGGTEVRAGQRDIQSIQEARVALERGAVRLSGLFMTLHEVLPRYAEPLGNRKPPSGLVRYMALMDGHFRIADNGDWVLLPT